MRLLGSAPVQDIRAAHHQHRQQRGRMDAVDGGRRRLLVPFQRRHYRHAWQVVLQREVNFLQDQATLIRLLPALDRRPVQRVS